MNKKPPLAALALFLSSTPVSLSAPSLADQLKSCRADVKKLEGELGKCQRMISTGTKDMQELENAIRALERLKEEYRNRSSLAHAGGQKLAHDKW